jgi:hypothetical protein
MGFRLSAILAAGQGRQGSRCKYSFISIGSKLVAAKAGSDLPQAGQGWQLQRRQCVSCFTSGAYQPGFAGLVLR